MWEAKAGFTLRYKDGEPLLQSINFSAGGQTDRTKAEFGE